jgi:COP9 signalosome complex subunit 7
MFKDYLVKETYFKSKNLVLSPIQVWKLRQLTLVSLATKAKHLPYAIVLGEVGLATNRQLEDLVISCVYEGLLHAKCNPQLQVFIISWCMARDVRAEQELLGMLTKLEDWLFKAKEMTFDLDKACDLYAKERKQEGEFQVLVQKEADRVKTEVQRENSSSSTTAAAENKNKGGSLMNFMGF